jgi:hypothetical protein
MVQVTVTGLQNTNRQQVTTNPSFDNTLFVTTNAPNQCKGSSSIESVVKGNPTVDAYLQSIKLTQTLTNLKTFRDSVVRSQADTLLSLPENTSIESLKSYLASLNTSILPYYRLVNNCIKESTETKLNTYNEQKESTSESKERYEALKHPELKVGYYEGWFPIFRPMTETSLFALFSIACFFILFSLGFFLRMSGVEFNIQIPFFTESTSSFDLSSINLPMIGGLAVGIGGIIAAVGMNRGWF